MPDAPLRLNQILSALNETRGPSWDEVNRLWIDTLLDFDGMPEEHVLDRLGGSLHRRDRDALQQDIERALQFFTTRMGDPLITVRWQ